MNEVQLSPCRTCGKEISTNLAQGCPHCGEIYPHVTEEESERREQEQEQELLAPCRACGQMISKNLTVKSHEFSFGDGLSLTSKLEYGSCPHCGEGDPHMTEEQKENLRLERKVKEIVTAICVVGGAILFCWLVINFW